MPLVGFEDISLLLLRLLDRVLGPTGPGGNECSGATAGASEALLLAAAPDLGLPTVRTFHLTAQLNGVKRTYLNTQSQ